MVVMFVVWLGSLGASQAMYAWRQTQEVPIERVLTNLERQLSTDPNNPANLYHAARIHSMAWFNGTQMVVVLTNTLTPQLAPWDDGISNKNNAGTNVSPQNAGHSADLTKAIAYYERAAEAMTKGTNATTYRWLDCPIHLGLAWCLEQAGRREDAIKAYRKALIFAWDKEIHDQPTLKEQAQWSWDQIRAKKNPLTRPPPNGHIAPAPAVFYSQEIIRYLLKILDPVKDAKEIAQLKTDQQMLSKIPRGITPILVSLDAHTPLARLVNPSARVQFDLDGSGLPRDWGWITPKAAWLVFDKGSAGRITSGLQMFGNVTFWIFWRDGYEALSALDDNGDGILRGKELNGISLWEDANGNGICEPGEVHPVTDYGVVAIDCGSQQHETGIQFNPRGMWMKDGTYRATYDWIAPSQ